MCHERLETHLSCCPLQVLLSLKHLFLPSSVPHVINGDFSEVCRLPPAHLLDTEFQTAGMDIPRKYKIGRCVSWEAKVCEKTPWPDTAGKAFWPFLEACKVFWQNTDLHTYFEKSTLEYWLGL